MRVKLSYKANIAFNKIQTTQYIEDLIKHLGLTEVKSKVDISQLNNDQLQLLKDPNMLIELDNILQFTGASGTIALALLAADVRQKNFR